MLTDDEVQKMIADLSKEDEALAEVARRVGIRRARVQAALAAMTAVSSASYEPAEFEGKLADALRTVLKKSTKPMTPVELRDELKAIGYDLAKHTNALASIHSVLKRLAESEAKEVKMHEHKEGARYSWIVQADSPAPAKLKLRSIGPSKLLTLTGDQLVAPAFEPTDYKTLFKGIFDDHERMAASIEEGARLVQNTMADPTTEKLVREAMETSTFVAAQHAALLGLLKPKP